MSGRSRRRLAISVAAKFDVDDALLSTRKRWGAEQRRRYRDQIYQALRALIDCPERGRPRDEFDAGCRSFVVDHHVVFYYLTENENVVDRVLHGSQDATDTGSL
jgi:toxin ParE1/3/4